MENKELENKNIFTESIDKPQVEKKGAVLILQLIEENDVWLFHDQLNEAYIALEGDGSTVMRIDSQEFNYWLSNFVLEETGKIGNKTMLEAIIGVMKYKARKLNLFELSVRVAKKDMEVWYDLGDKYFVRINCEGWTIVESPQNILFKRFKHQKNQVHPEREGNINEFMDFVNLKDEKEKLLFMVYLISAFIPNFPHPVLVVHGSQGSAKSTLCRLLKDLIDPSALETSSINNDHDIQELVQVASHHWFLVLDNLSYLSEKISDTISRICTGGGLSKRRLYANDDDFIYSFKHLVAMNGIHQIINKPDLLDRSILLALDRIPEEKRMTEQELWERFNSMKQKLLGAIFDAVAGAIREYPSVQQYSLPRMADFGKWGCAIAKGLGYKAEDFINVYGANIGRQNQEAISASSIALTIIKFMEDKDFYEDTPSDLLGRLDPVAVELKVKETKDYPRNANWIWRRIADVIPNLVAVGIKVEQDKGTTRKIRLQKITNQQGNIGVSGEIPTSKITIPDEPEDNTDNIDSISSLAGF